MKTKQIVMTQHDKLIPFYFLQVMRIDFFPLPIKIYTLKLLYVIIDKFYFSKIPAILDPHYSRINSVNTQSLTDGVALQLENQHCETALGRFPIGGPLLS